jgi:hypothetical protein
LTRTAAQRGQAARARLPPQRDAVSCCARGLPGRWPRAGRTMTTSSSCCSLATAVRPGAADVRALFGGRRRCGAMVERPRLARDRGPASAGRRRRGEELPAAALQRGLVHIQLHHHYRVRAAGQRSSRGAAHLAALRRGVTLCAAGAQHRLQNKEDPAGEQVGEAADLGHGRAGALPHHHQRCALCRAAAHQAAVTL